MQCKINKILYYVKKYLIFKLKTFNYKGFYAKFLVCEINEVNHYNMFLLLLINIYNYFH